MTHVRRPIVAGNWKMNGDRALVSDFIDHFSQISFSACELVLCPPNLFLIDVINASTKASWKIGAQTVSEYDNGAHTGDVSAVMLSSLGCDYVIVGHSERRSDHHESNQAIADKTKKALAKGLIPIVCCGESLETRENGEQERFVSSQLNAVFDVLSDDEIAQIVIAYEPIWAIGTGVTASPEQAQAMHASIRGLLLQRSAELANSVQILYGGSVKSGNAEALFSQPDIDGGLIGGASLQAKEFEAICQAAEDVATSR